MGKFSDLLRTKWAAVAIWIIVMYLTALLWSVMDDDSWFAVPTYIVTMLVWIGSFVNAAGYFLEWTGSGIRLKQQPTSPVDTSENDV